jgi:hypothetical protein
LSKDRPPIYGSALSHIHRTVAYRSPSVNLSETSQANYPAQATAPPALRESSLRPACSPASEFALFASHMQIPSRSSGKPHRSPQDRQCKRVYALELTEKWSFGANTRITHLAEQSTSVFPPGTVTDYLCIVIGLHCRRATTVRQGQREPVFES